ncbi:MAG: lipoprotein insertase outer membrane protein LolB [Syntrophobacteraceae bacterium]
MVRWLLSGLVVLVLSACAGPAVREGIVTSWSETQQSKLLERSEYWRSYQATLHVTAETEKGRVQRVKTLVLAVPPDRFRLEAMSPFGSTVALLLAEPSGASLWVPSEQALLTAERAEVLVKQAIGVPLPVEALAYSLAAAVPPDQLKGAVVEKRDGGFVLQAKESRHGWAFTWTYLNDPFALKQLTVRGAEREYSITYDPPVDVEVGAVPNRISVVTAEGQIDVKVDQIKSAPSLQEAAFRVTFPENVRRIDLGRGTWKGKDL